MGTTWFPGVESTVTDTNETKIVCKMYAEYLRNQLIKSISAVQEKKDLLFRNDEIFTLCLACVFSLGHFHAPGRLGQESTFLIVCCFVPASTRGVSPLSSHARMYRLVEENGVLFRKAIHLDGDGSLVCVCVCEGLSNCKVCICARRWSCACIF
jgi:hypothetical protein